MNQSLLAIVGALTLLMLVIFVATGQQWNLTATAVICTGALGVAAVYFYGREEAAQQGAADDGSEDEEEIEPEAVGEGEETQAG